MVVDGRDEHDARHVACCGDCEPGWQQGGERDDVRGGEVKAVIDRFEYGWAVLLVGDEERRVNVPRKALPRGAREGHWLQVELEGDQFVGATIDREETARARQRIADKLEQLRRGEHLK